MTNKINYLIVACLAFMVCYLSWNTYLINTGDFDRVVLPFMEGVKAFSKNLSFTYKFKDSFDPISSYDYKSSYSYILYAYAGIVSLFTDKFDIHVFGTLLKVAYIFSLYLLFSNFTEKKGVIYTALFILTSIFLYSSSNVAFFNSFYQEQVLLICLPLICSYAFRNDNKALIITTIAMVIIATSKSQFFYAPLIVFSMYAIFNRQRIAIKSLCCMFSLILSIICVLGSSSATSFNKYHANFFGVYVFAKSNNLTIPDSVDTDCIGIDAWGNKFSKKDGAERTDIGMKCFDRNTSYGFKEVLNWIKENPSFIYKVPYDDGIKTQLTENYFHVFKNLKLIVNNEWPLSSITEAKDKLFEKSKFTILLIVMLISLISFRNSRAGIFFFLSSFGVSQMYVAFLGEGYRDLDKHLFGMNIAFDLVAFILAAISVVWLVQVTIKIKAKEKPITTYQ